MSDITAVVEVWKNYLRTVLDWRELIKEIQPKQTGCGLVYALPNPIDRPNESFAIADMRQLRFAEPHYHPLETEIYIILEGSGIVVVGGKEHVVNKSSVVITPPDTTHFTIPNNNLVLAAINTPPFKPENYVVITQTDHTLGFNEVQFVQLTTKI